MGRARTLLLATAVALAGTSLFWVMPAEAAPAVPGVGAVDTSIPGHASVTITSSAPFVFARWRGEWSSYLPVAMTGGTGTLDVETWGTSTSSGLQFQVLACSSNDIHTDCAEGRSARFAPRDSVPQVTFSEDTTVGPGQPIAVTVSDPSGGGILVATWAYEQFPLDRSGTTQVLPTVTGIGNLRVERCGPTYCSEFTPTVRKQYDVRLDSTGTSHGIGRGGTIAPINTVRTTTPVTVLTPEAAGSAYSLTWEVVPTTSGAPAPVATGTASGVLGNGGATAPFAVDGTGLADGTYEFRATYSVESPEFGSIPGKTEPAELVVDNTPNTGQSALIADRTLIYPLAGGRLGVPQWVGFSAAKAPAKGDDMVEVRSPAGALVFDGQMGWGGTYRTGKVVPAGVYTATLVDRNGNPSMGVAPVKITVSGKRILRLTYNRTLSASGTLVDAYVGRCSTLRKPSLRKWSGSLGMYANTKCKKQTARASAVSTTHAVKLPPALRTISTQVSVYGGAAKSKKRSLAVISYLRTNGKWGSSLTIGSAMGVHRGIFEPTKSTAKDSSFVFSDDYLVWGMDTGFGHRYDVKNFTVTVQYFALG